MVLYHFKLKTQCVYIVRIGSVRGSPYRCLQRRNDTCRIRSTFVDNKLCRSVELLMRSLSAGGELYNIWACESALGVSPSEAKKSKKSNLVFVLHYFFNEVWLLLACVFWFSRDIVLRYSCVAWCWWWCFFHIDFVIGLHPWSSSIQHNNDLSKWFYIISKLKTQCVSIVRIGRVRGSPYRCLQRCNDTRRIRSTFVDNKLCRSVELLMRTLSNGGELYNIWACESALGVSSSEAK